MNFEEIKKLFNTRFELTGDYYYDEISLITFIFRDDFNINDYPTQFSKIGPMERIERFDAGQYLDGLDDDIGYLRYKQHVVYYLPQHDMYIKFTGWVSSYSDTEFDDMKQVYPQQKTITVYE